VLEGVHARTRLRLLAEQIGRDIGPLSPAQEAETEREIAEAVREVRRSKPSGG
jgi:hypothetical protein